MFLEYFEGLKMFVDSPLHRLLQQAPKGGHLHVHIEAFVPMEDFFEYTREDYVYYNIEKNKLKTAPLGLDEPGYVPCNTLRKTWDKEGTFDDYLLSNLVLRPELLATRESKKIWKMFQEIFDLNADVIHYHKFYRAGLLSYYKQAVEEGISIVEVRHVSGNIFKDDLTFLTYQEEFELYQSVIDEIREGSPTLNLPPNPDFELRVIIVAYKALGKEFVREQLRSYHYAMDNHFDFVSGFDLVNYEDYVEPIYTFIDDILEAMKGYPDFSFYFHAGESVSRFNENLYDAIALGTKRVGHGFNVAVHPHLMQLVKEQNIGYEVCPISNFVLGYTLDFRWHPGRILMVNGIGVTLSSDAPAFYGYKDLAVDFTYAVVAWELDLKDVKQLAINSIKYSSLKPAQKEKQLAKFHKDWNKFVSSYVSQLKDSSKSTAK